MSILSRAKAPTPRFFKKVRRIGLLLAAVSGAVLAAPVALPLVITQVAGYLAVAGTVATAVSQVTTKAEEEGTIDDYRFPF